nr:hypothetical protein [uncultured Pedobacter sp.]
MKINRSQSKARLLQSIRTEYQRKRRTKKYKTRKSRNKLIRKLGLKGEIVTQAKSPIIITLPYEFSMISKTNDLLKIIELAKAAAKKRNPIHFEIEHIKSLTQDAIAVLIGIISDGDFNKINISGGIPAEPIVRELFIKSGFFNYVRSNITTSGNINLLLHQRSNKQVNTAIAKEACTRGILHTFKKLEIFEPLYDILIECMSNTHNHADPKEDGVYDWWLSTHFDDKTNITYYSFFDLGVGIFESISVKDYKEALRNMGLIKNIDLINDLYKGEIKSRTHLPERGKGLPQIHSYAGHPNIKNLTLITNNVSSNMSKNTNFELKFNFSGTFYYWELHP